MRTRTRAPWRRSFREKMSRQGSPLPLTAKITGWVGKPVPQTGATWSLENVGQRGQGRPRTRLPHFRARLRYHAEDLTSADLRTIFET